MTLALTRSGSGTQIPMRDVLDPGARVSLCVRQRCVLALRVVLPGCALV